MTTLTEQKKVLQELRDFIVLHDEEGLIAHSDMIQRADAALSAEPTAQNPVDLTQAKRLIVQLRGEIDRLKTSQPAEQVREQAPAPVQVTEPPKLYREFVPHSVAAGYFARDRSGSWCQVQRQFRRSPGVVVLYHEAGFPEPTHQPIASKPQPTDKDSLTVRQPEASGKEVVWLQYLDGVKTQNVAQNEVEKASIEEMAKIMAPAAKLEWIAFCRPDAAPSQPAQSKEIAELEAELTKLSEFNRVLDKKLAEFNSFKEPAISDEEIIEAWEEEVANADELDVPNAQIVAFARAVRGERQ